MAMVVIKLAIGTITIIRYLLINPLNPELNPICYFLALLAHHFLHVSRIRVNSLTLRLLMSYMEHLFLMFLDHTQQRSTVGRTPLDEWSARRRDLYLTTHDTHNRQISTPPVGFEPTISAGERPQAAHLLRSLVRIPPGAWIFVCCECRVLSGRGLCDELVTRPEESYRLWWVVCDLETSRIGSPYTYIYIYIYIYNISSLRVKLSAFLSLVIVKCQKDGWCLLLLKNGWDIYEPDPRTKSVADQWP